MAYLGLTNGTTSSASNTSSQRNGTRTPELLDLDNEKPTDSNAILNAKETENFNRLSEERESKDHSNEVESWSGEIRIGKDYQVVTPNWIPLEQRRPELNVERELLVWSPNPTLNQQKLDEYIQVSKEKYGYSADQAFGMLFWHKYDFDKAIQDLANFTPFPDEWTVEETALFEQAFQFHGKSFRRIRQMLPHKSIANLVKHYYSWKKLRARTSLMDNHARMIKNARTKHDLIEKSATAILHPNENIEKKFETDTVKSKTQELNMLDSKLIKDNSRPPMGMYINRDDLVTLANCPNKQDEHLLKSINKEVVSYKRVVQNNKQLLSSLHQKSRNRTIVEPYEIPTDPSSTINAKWSNEEILLGVQGMRTFGKNFTAIAEVIGTKTESHVRSFYVNYRRRYNLDTVLKEYEEEHGPTSKDETNDNIGIKSSSPSESGTSND